MYAGSPRELTVVCQLNHQFPMAILLRDPSPDFQLADLVGTSLLAPGAGGSAPYAFTSGLIRESGIDPSMVRLHVCWGNYEGPHTHDVDFAEIQPLLYRAHVGALVLSMANARHAHEFHCFEDRPLPDGMALVAGVIDTTSNYVEHPEVVADRLVTVARAIGDVTRLVAGTDCGFDTSAGIGDVAPSVVWRKLEALRDGAALASSRLFPGGAA